ncbi:helix-turn-helix domain-containing protein [Asanoa iriomotensis]|uniref:Resolvase HTH domain-containing protein n=1 Tax=Asanoa iriomotensis TaxID=234613 RepID=A0ABQ4C1I4_9ACTN|nr:helix-turn-helix domain-containing protein [Asanoa iriomotensis]GIF56642.1 hypothetical protein Air01nite_27370 [Asanoa iriomotensis]
MTKDSSTPSLLEAVRALTKAQAKVVRARKSLDAARAEVEQHRRAVADAAVIAHRNGMRQKEIAERTGLTRETIRKYLRAVGINAND